MCEKKNADFLLLDFVIVNNTFLLIMSHNLHFTPKTTTTKKNERFGLWQKLTFN